ncbi:nickel/cobalt transporter [Chelativorans sp. AA-79]|uniref:nickel/cobalt transporter n=1 Tax=Chelativorans sp. AA-79 TaxID=3028735 RepID=UPI0023FA2DE5|nr:nickel/cobalt transporter [Chelativorans sp. AA-79]WEX10385.1 nickel/cobalt transporter [Chelativorans sp. AA-79]
MSKRASLPARLLLLTAATALLLLPAHAQSSLGIGTAEPSVAPVGPFAGILQWVNSKQQSFYRALTGALKAMREDVSQLWMLIGLSFAYGIFHAAGPGHGKAVISSYMLANEVALRRGIVLSFASAILQALTAITVMGAVFLLLRGTAVSMTDATWFLETLSYGLIAAFGAWLLWRKVGPLVRQRDAGQPMHSLSAAHAGEHHHHHVHDGHDHHDHDHAQHDHHHDHAAGEVCPTCGHSHAPDPAQLSGDRLDWKSAWSAVAAVGMRPCSGALIVLTFSFLNALWLGGIVSVFAMALGTAITVSVLAILAVTAKNWAVALSGGGAWGARIHNGIEIAGALLVLLLGLVLLAASLSA